MNFLPFQGLPFFVNLAIKIGFLFITSRVLHIEFWNLVSVFTKWNCIYNSILVKKWQIPLWIENELVYYPFPLKFPSPNFRLDVHFAISDVEPKTSKGRGNFLLQHETRVMGVVVFVVKQIRGWTRRIINRHPELIAFFQVQCRLKGQRTPLINGALILLNKTHPD